MGNCFGKEPKGAIPLKDSEAKATSTTTTTATSTSTSTTTSSATGTTTSTTAGTTTSTTSTTPATTAATTGATTATAAPHTSATTTKATTASTSTTPASTTTTSAPAAEKKATSTSAPTAEKKVEKKERPKREYTTIKSNNPVKPTPVLMVSVISASLKKTNNSDPYIKFYLLDGTKMIGKTVCTSVINQCLEPVWTGEVVDNFGLTPGSVLVGKTLVAELWDKDRMFDDFLGMASMPLGADGAGKFSKGTPGILDNTPSLVKMAFRRRPGKPGSEESKTMTDPLETGTLQCTVHWKSCDVLLGERPAPSLKIHQFKGHDLMNMDSIGKSDPYVVLKIIKPRPAGLTEKKTDKGEVIKVRPPGTDTVLFTRKTKWIENTLDPIWTECFDDFRLLPGQTLIGLRLDLEIWDQDDLSADDFMGKTSLVFGSEQLPINTTKTFKETLVSREGMELKDKINKGQLEFTIEYKESAANAAPHAALPFKGEWEKSVHRGQAGMPYLSVAEMKCTGLMAADRSGTSDPYLRVNLVDGERVSAATHTRTIPKTLNPDWEDDELVNFELTRGTTLLGKMLHIQAFDSDMLVDDFLGEVWLELGKEIVDGKESYIKCALVPRVNRETGVVLDKGIKGELYITVRLESSQWVSVCRPAPILRFSKLRAEGLLDTDWISKADPYLKVKLQAGNKQTQFKYTSHVIDGCLTPDWGEFTCDFWNIAPGTRLTDHTCIIQIFDKDVFLKDDFMGEIAFDFAEKPEEKKVHGAEEQKHFTLVSGKEQKLDFALLPRVASKDKVAGKIFLTVHYEERPWTTPPPASEKKAVVPALKEFEKVAGVYVYAENPSITAQVDGQGNFSSEKAGVKYKLQYVATTWEERLLCLPVSKKVSGLHHGDVHGKNHGGHTFDPSQTGGILEAKDDKPVLLTKVTIHFTENLLLGLEMAYNNGKSCPIGECKSKTPFVLELKDGERISRVGIRADAKIEAITFWTTSGRVTSTFGNKAAGEAKEMSMTNNEILAFFGSFIDNHIDSLGCIFRELPADHPAHVGNKGTELRMSQRVGVEQNNNRGFDLSKANIFCPKPMTGVQMPLELLPGMVPPVISSLTIHGTEAHVSGVGIVYSNKQTALCGGTANGTAFELLPGEFITAVHIRGDQYIEGLQVIANSGRKSVWAGLEGKQQQQDVIKLIAPPGFEVIGFHGTFTEAQRTGARLDTLGVIFRTVEISRPGPSGNPVMMHQNSTEKTGGTEFFTMFRVAGGSVNVLALRNADYLNGIWTRVNTRGLQVEPKMATNMPVVESMAWYPDKFQAAAPAGRLQPWVEGRVYALVRTTDWQVKQYTCSYKLNHSLNATDEHKWNIFLGIPPPSTRTRDYRVKVTAGGQELMPKLIQCREQSRFGEKALVIPYQLKASNAMDLEVTCEWQETGNQLVVVAAMPGAKVDGVNDGAVYRGITIAPPDGLRFTMSDAVYSWDNEEVRNFIQSRITKPGDNRNRAVDIARRVLQYLAGNVLLAEERDANELKRMGPYAQHDNFPKLIMLLRAETANPAEHGILFVGLMRACGVPARRLRVLNSRGLASKGWAEFFCPNLGWVAVKTTDKTVYLDRAGGDFNDQPDIVTGFEDGYAIDLRLTKDSPPKLARVPLDLVYPHPLQNGFTAVKTHENLTKIASFTVAVGSYGTNPEVDWFKETTYRAADILFIPPAIHVPTPPIGAIETDNQALIAAFQKMDHVETSLSYCNLLKTGKFQQAQDLFVHSLSEEVLFKHKYRLERRLKEGKDDSKEKDKEHPMVGYLNETFREIGLEHVESSWPAKNDIELPPKDQCSSAPILNLGNNAVEIGVPIKVNGTQVLVKFEFVHSRGGKIFDIVLAFNPKYAKAEVITERRDR